MTIFQSRLINSIHPQHVNQSDPVSFASSFVPRIHLPCSATLQICLGSGTRFMKRHQAQSTKFLFLDYILLPTDHMQPHSTII
jgi:hypothetical protein